MAKRKNRVRAIQHHHNQIEATKTLEPNTTPVRWRPFSDALLEVAMQALEIARRLEARGTVSRQRFEQLVAQVQALPDLVPHKDDEE